MRSSKVLRRLGSLALIAVGLNASYITKPSTGGAIFPSSGTPLFVQAAEGHSAVTPTSLTVSFGVLPTVGNVAMIGLFGDGISSALIQTAKMADNQGNAYSAIRAQPAASASQTQISMLWCGPITVSSGTYTVTATLESNASLGLFALEYSGMSCNPEKVNGAVTATSPYNCGSVTTVNANDLLLAMLYIPGATGTVTFTAPSGFTIEKSQTVAATGQVASIADKIVSATGTTTPTYSANQNHSSQCVLAAIMSK